MVAAASGRSKTVRATSRRCSTPTISSASRACTGTRERARPRKSRIASSIVAWASMVTMSVRGIITSRATVSPHSKIEWMSSRSSFSSTSSSVASSTMLSSCSSEVNVEARGRPGVTRVAEPREHVGERPEQQAGAADDGRGEPQHDPRVHPADAPGARADEHERHRGHDHCRDEQDEPRVLDESREGEGDEHGGARLGEHAKEVDRVDVRARIRGDREQRAAEPGPEGQVLRLGARQGRHGRVAGGEQAAEDDQHDRDDQEEGGHRLTGAASPARRSPRACRAAPGTSPAPPPPRRDRSRAGAGVRGR